jgi:hypothetical protein
VSPSEAPFSRRFVLHDIRITLQADLSHYSVFHECLHVTLIAEKVLIGWVDYAAELFDSRNHHRMVIGGLSNSLHHPAIYSRMETEFRLPMSPYWSQVIAGATQRIDLWAETPAGPEKKQFDIIAVLFAYLIPALEVICAAFALTLHDVTPEDIAGWFRSRASYAMQL